MKSIFSFGNTPIATCVLATFKPHCISHCVAGIEIGLIRCYTIYTNMVWATLLFTTKEDDLVFSRPYGSLLKPTNMTHSFKDFARKLRLDGVRFHDLRHTHASLMLAQGVHPKIVSERLGHATVSITLDTYSHVTPGLQEAAARRFEEGLVSKAVAKAPSGV